MKKVTIYTTLSCGYCKMAKEFFKENNVNYSEKDVGSDPTALQEMIAKSKQMGVPVIVVEEEIVIGFDKSKLKELLEIS